MDFHPGVSHIRLWPRVESYQKSTKLNGSFILASPVLGRLSFEDSHATSVWGVRGNDKDMFYHLSWDFLSMIA